MLALLFSLLSISQLNEGVQPRAGRPSDTAPIAPGVIDPIATASTPFSPQGAENVIPSVECDPRQFNGTPSVDVATLIVNEETSPSAETINQASVSAWHMSFMIRLPETFPLPKIAHVGFYPTAPNDVRGGGPIQNRADGSYARFSARVDNLPQVCKSRSIVINLVGIPRSFCVGIVTTDACRRVGSTGGVLTGNSGEGGSPIVRSDFPASNSTTGYASGTSASCQLSLDATTPPSLFALLLGFILIFAFLRWRPQ